MNVRKSLTILIASTMYAFPAVALAQLSRPGVPVSGTGITLRDIVYTVQRIINQGIILATLAVVAMIVYAGFKMATSSGKEEDFKKAKQMLKYAIYGALVVFGVGLIVNTIANLAYDPTNVLY